MERVKHTACAEPMVERDGLVVAVQADRALVRFERVAACGACRVAGLCASGKDSRDLPVPVPGGRRLEPGDRVRVGISEASALRATALAYLTPLAGLLAGLLAAAFLGLGEAGAAGLTLSGLAVGLLAMRPLSRLPANRPALALIDTFPARNPTEPDS